jgi:hypothetical protein
MSRGGWERRGDALFRDEGATTTAAAAAAAAAVARKSYTEPAEDAHLF